MAIAMSLSGLLLLGGVGTMALAPATAAAPEEMAEARLWVAAKLGGVQETRLRETGLVVLANHGAVQPNARAGKPLRIVDRQYRRGLYCHAPSHIIVRLPGPAKRFLAVAGVDSNEQTGGGRGSVVFSVSVEGKEAFKTDVVREGMPGIPVDVDLAGASELALGIGDAGDGNACDQGDWADARAALADGTEVWLGDLRLLEGAERAPYTTEPPFSFSYGGRPSAELLPTWKVERASRALDAARTEHVLTYTDPATGLVVRCAGIAYRDFPTVEWVIRLRNTGPAGTPILSDIQALDTRFERGSQGEFALHHHVGTLVAPKDYQPLETPLPPKAEERFAPPGGRPCGTVFPYFGLAGGSEGVLLAVGWPGQWAASFTRDEGLGVRVRAGQEQTRFVLHPGEEVRTPLIALQFWKGDRVRAQNTWRRWMVAHNVPRPGGKLPEPMLPAVSGNQFPGLLCNEADELLYLRRYDEERIPITHWWMDAGWYLNKGDWTSTGTWEMDRQRFPRGFRPISEWLHARGKKLIVWFEPERVTAGSWLADTHPEWVLGGKAGGLLDLGNPQAWRWLVEHIDHILTEEGIDLYRQDFNMDPLAYWRANDAPDRQGITEIRHVEGYLAFWDELRRRHPNMLIDSCASGGHRNDLETLRRSVPLLRSDYIFDNVGEQCHTYGLAQWVPFYGTGFIEFDAYTARSVMGVDMTLGCDARKEIDWELLRKLVVQWRQVAPNYLGDFYPLTPYSLENTAWMAWQLDRPEAGEGMVQVFRRAESIYESARLKLRGLDPNARYRVRDLDQASARVLAGRELMERGYLAVLPEAPSAAVVTYHKVAR